MEIQVFQQLKSKFVTRDVGDELIIVPLTGNVAQMNALFTLNETGKFIWENTTEEKSIEQLVLDMTETFDIDSATARNDIEAFLTKIAITLA